MPTATIWYRDRSVSAKEDSLAVKEELPYKLRTAFDTSGVQFMGADLQKRYPESQDAPVPFAHSVSSSSCSITLSDLANHSKTCSANQPIGNATVALEGIYPVEGGDGLAAGVFGVFDSVIDE